MRLQHACESEPRQTHSGMPRKHRAAAPCRARSMQAQECRLNKVLKSLPASHYIHLLSPLSTHIENDGLGNELKRCQEHASLHAHLNLREVVIARHHRLTCAEGVARQSARTPSNGYRLRMLKHMPTKAHAMHHHYFLSPM